MKNLISCWGNFVEKESIKGNMYLSYIVNKNNFDLVSLKGVNLEKFDYIEIIYNQLTARITLELKNNDGEDMLMDVPWDCREFFRIIYLTLN